MRGSTFPFALMKTYGSISVDLRDKLIFSLSLSFSSRSHTLTTVVCFLSFVFLFDFLSFFFLTWIHGSYCTMCPSLIRVRFFLEIIYLFSVKFILNELNSSNFLTFEIFVKISSLESLTTYHPENCKNIPTVSKFDENFLGY